MEDTNVGIVASKPLFPASTKMSPHLHASTPTTHVPRPASPPGSVGLEGVPEERYGPGGEDAQHATPGPSMPSRSSDCPRVRMYVDLQLAPVRPTDPPCSMISDSPQEENSNDLMQNGLDKSVPALTDGQALPNFPTTSSSVTLGSCQPHCGRGPTRVYLGTQDNDRKWQSEATPAGVTVSVGQAKEDPCVKLLDELLDCNGETGTGAEPNEEPGIIENPGESLHLSHIHCHFLDDLLDGINRGAIQNDQSTSATQENQTTTPTPQEEQKDEAVAASLQRQQTRPTSELIQELAEEDGSEQQDPTSPLPAQVMQQEPFQLSHDVKLQDTTSPQHDLHIKDTTDSEEIKATPSPQAVLDVPLNDPSLPLAVHNTPLLDTQTYEEPSQTAHEGNKQETLPLEVVSGVPNECVVESNTQTQNPPSKLQVEASQTDEGEPPPPSGHDQVDEVVPTLPINSDGGVSRSTVTGVGRQEDDTTQPSPSIHTSPDPIPLQELEEVSLEAASQEPENQETTSVSDQGNHRPGNSEMPLASTESGCDEDEDEERRSGLAAAVSRVVRRSMRRMRRFRLSGRGAPQATGGSEEGDMSEETQIRRGLPNAPPLGLSTVRSPAAASIIVSSLMAALSPPPTTGPRETLPPPGTSQFIPLCVFCPSTTTTTTIACCCRFPPSF
ncbi:hypothetical protein Pmani_026769 [Petrolisthes manimaculis]|uniref:Uncharacterized protein n=1 Tax=Petrolisthes manimaculis TaxID=1843537 RepID=A0AAE1TZS9_9EUCA|nr:hypothetical protein Pmani_026769 [Petrolisthes manimaculis]